MVGFLARIGLILGPRIGSNGGPVKVALAQLEVVFPLVSRA
jgi:hypothetical protein